MAEELRIFGPEGTHERTFGGPGGGPGELRQAQGVLLDPDGYLRVPENGNARDFDPDSGFVRSKRLNLFVTAGSGPWRAAMDDSGNTAVWSAGRYRNGFCMMVRMYDHDMVRTDSIPYHDYTHEQGAVRGVAGAWPITASNGMRTAIPIPFYSRAQFVIAPSRQIWSTEAGISALEVARWQPAGDTVLVIRSERSSEPVTEAERDSAIAAIEARFAAWSGSLPTNPGDSPDTKPPVHYLSLDRQGRLWVRITGPNADSTLYDVFGRDGRFAETVLLGERVDRRVPPVVDGELLWAVVLDDADVQYVLKAHLTPPDR